MQQYPSIKNGMLGWRRLEGDDIPKKQIWMVFEEESDIYAQYSGLKDSENPQDLHSLETNLSRQENINFSIDKNNFYSDKVKEDIKFRSIYDFHSEDSEPDEITHIFKGQLKTYSRKCRYSELVKRQSNWESSSDNDEKEKRHVDLQTKSKRKFRKKLKVIYSKPKKYMKDITIKTLKDEKNQSNYTKKKLFNPNDLRTSSRRRKIVNYSEYQDECNDDSSSDYEEESESDNDIFIKKKVECPAKVKTSQLSAYEQMVERNKEANRRMLEEMGIFQAKTDLVDYKTRNISNELKPENCMKDITNKELENNPRKYSKRKFINPSNDVENRERNNRSSSRRRKVVNYAENQDESFSSGPEKESENENEDENRNKIKNESSNIVDTPQLSAYEQMVERNKEANRRMLEEMGIFQLKTEMVTPKTTKKYTKAKHVTDMSEIRRSHRLKKRSHTKI